MQTIFQILRDPDAQEATRWPGSGSAVCNFFRFRIGTIRPARACETRPSSADEDKLRK